VTLAPLLQVVVALSGAAPQSSAQAALDDAVQFFESFEDERAAMKFRALLARAPPGEIAAKVHLYLGIIAFDDMKPDVARTEFRRALEANPAVELPPKTSPKTRLAFGGVRHALELEMDPGTRGSKPAAAPAAAISAPVLVIEAEPPSHSHTAAYILGGATLVLTGLAIYGGGQVIGYNGMIETPPQYTLNQIQSAQGSASFWAVGWIVAAGLAAAGLTGAILTW
jgi:hypothetical protein